MIIGLALVALLAFGPTVVAPTPDSSASPWVDLAAKDVDAFCADIRGVHPGIVDPLSPKFASQVDRACHAADERARNAGSFLDWMEIMQGLVTSFRDGHTGIAITVVPTQLRWPGFLIDGQGGRWVVRRPPGIAVAAGNPHEGAELVGCDGQPAERFLEQQLDQKTVDWSKAPERIRQAFRAFTTYHLDGAAPARECQFRENGKIADVRLEWRPITYVALQPLLAACQPEGERHAA